MNPHRRRDVSRSARSTRVTIAPPDRHRRRSFPRPQGTPAPRSSRAGDVEPIVSINMDTLDREILAALADGPLMKWEIRERVHVDEQIIFRQLKKLKAAGKVKVTGKVLDKRAWALIGWQRPVAAPASGFATHPGRRPTAKGPSTSWWATPGLTRADFNQQLQRRDQECGRENRSAPK